MFKHFGKRKGFKSIARKTGDFDNIQDFGKTDNIKEARHENLKIIKHIFEKNEIRYCLIFGTLLGQYRENDFIEGDQDDDLYVDPKDSNKFNDSMLKELENHGFLWLRTYENRLISIGRNGRYIDLCFIDETQHEEYKKEYYHYTGEYFYHKKYFDDEFKLGYLNGEAYPVINNTRGFLEAQYGKDFMIPKRRWEYVENRIVKWIPPLEGGFDWKSVWNRKGAEDTTDLLLLDGYENTDMVPSIAAKNIQDTLGVDQNSTMLEVGCGAGMLAQFFNCEYTGVDYSETLIEKHLCMLGNNVSVAEANNLPFEDNSFDYVITISVFHYFPNKNYVNDAISEMQRVAKKAIFIGDLPVSSHDNNHLLFSKDDFHEWVITPSCYNDVRFNAHRRLIEDDE